jgi:hypothetical protein
MKTKVMLLVVVSVALCVLTGSLAAQPSRPTMSTQTAPLQVSGQTSLQTRQDSWQLLRSTDANDTALTPATKVWTTVYSKFVTLPPEWNSIDVACFVDGNTADPNLMTFSWKLMGCRQFSSAELMAYGTWAVGEEELSNNPCTSVVLTRTNEDKKWCELPVITAQYWSSAIAPGGTEDSIGKLTFDPLGCWGIYVEVTSIARSVHKAKLYFVVTGR